MPSVTDWLMVGITAIYVVATIIISLANINSAKATREQVEESKRQYEDKKRLEIMPYIQFEKSNSLENYKLGFALDSGENLNGKYVLNTRMKNIGMGTAKDITYSYQWDNCTKSYDHGPFTVQSLSSGESQVLMMEFSYSSNSVEEKTAGIILRYKDLLGNQYLQQLTFKFLLKKRSVALDYIELKTSSPILLDKEGKNA